MQLLVSACALHLKSILLVGCWGLFNGIIISFPACTFLLPFCRQWKNNLSSQIWWSLRRRLLPGSIRVWWFIWSSGSWIRCVGRSIVYRCSLTLVELQNFGIKQVYNLKRFSIYNICVVVVWCVWGRLNPFAFVSFAPRHCKLANLEHRNCISVALRNNHQCWPWVFHVCNVLRSLHSLVWWEKRLLYYYNLNLWCCLLVVKSH